MTLFFDDFASAKGDVTPKITTLLNWTKPTKKSLETGRLPAAPLVQFEWGGNPQLDTFKGFISQLDVTYRSSARTARRSRRRSSSRSRAGRIPPKGTNPTSHADEQPPDPHTRRGRHAPVGRLRELGKPTYWRAIAELNGIDDPLRIAPGTAAAHPDAADAARSS